MSAELNSDSLIRVHCVKHKTEGHPVPRSSRLVCDIQEDHVLAENFPHDGFWDYCCVCDVFRPSDAFQQKQAAEVCPVCTKGKIQRRFLCNVCNVMTVESDESSQSKLFTLIPDDCPSPRCPGCLTIVTETLTFHDCVVPLLIRYITARRRCPFCNEPIAQPTADEKRTRLAEDALPELSGNANEEPRFPYLESFSTSVSPFSRLKAQVTWVIKACYTWHSPVGAIASFIGLILTVIALVIAIGSLAPPAIGFAKWHWGEFFNNPPLLGPIECGQSVEGGGDSLLLKAHANDADGEPLKYTWITLPQKLGRIEVKEDRSQAVFITDGINPVAGPIKITIEVAVSDKYTSVSARQDIFVTPRANHVPRLTEGPRCDCLITEVRAGERVSLEAFAEDDDKADTLTYLWQTSLPTVQIIDAKSARGSRVILDTSGLSPQLGPIEVKVSLSVSDGHSMTVPRELGIRVWPKQTVRFGEGPSAAPPTNHNPNIEQLSVRKNPEDEGESVELRTFVTDPDGDAPIYYHWQASAGSIQNNNETATLNTSGINVSEVIVILTVSDGKGGHNAVRTIINVTPRPAKSTAASPSPSVTEKEKSDQRR